MIDKRLMKEMPEAKQFVMKQVAMQWMSLLCNIGFVFVIARLFVTIMEDTVNYSGILISTAVVAVLIIIRIATTKKASTYSYLASCDVKDHLRRRLYQKLLLLKNDYASHVATSELVQLSVEGIDQLETYFGRYLPQFFYSMLAPVTLFIILVWLDFRSALVLLICVPLIPLSIVAVQKFAKKLLSKYWTSYATLGDSFLENLQGLTTLKIYQADEYKNEEMNKEAENFRKITMKVLTMQLNSVSVMDIVAYGGAAIGCIVAISNYMNGTIPLFAVICIVLLSSEFFIPLRLLGSFFHIAMNGIAASAKIFRILDLPVEEQNKKQFNTDPISIAVKNLSFSYEEDREILHDISMDVQPGQWIGIVGESGSGKSTMAKLIVGLAKSYSGSLQLQGIERKDLDDTSFYNRILYVTHKPSIFKGTIRENLLLGKRNASDDELYTALKQVRLYDFIMSQDGLDTMMKEQGTNFSGGQNQRLSIARALLADKEVYIFDEATSNIDVESENAILDVIQTLAHKKTVIMITHRLANILDADQIYVMNKGTCEEQGTHEELMKAEGTYQTLYTKQMELEHYEGGGEDA